MPSKPMPPSPPVCPNLVSFAQTLLERLFAEHPLPAMPRLEWKRLRVTAGFAYYQENRIVLSASIVSSEERVERTLRHEYAHLMAYARHGRKGRGHGAAWKAAMLALGETPSVRHSYEVERNRPRQKVTYRCKKCRYEFHRSRRLPRRRRYTHVACGGALELVAVVATPGDADA